MKKPIIMLAMLFALALVAAVTLAACQNDADIETKEAAGDPGEPGTGELIEPNAPGGQEPGNGNPAPPPSPDVTARDYVDRFTAGDMAAVYQMGSEAMLAATSEQAFAGWRRDIEGAGEFVGHLVTDAERINEGGFDGNRYQITMQHTFARVVYNIFVESATPGEVSGFGIVDVDYTASAVDLPYMVETVAIGAGTPWELDGRLTLPFEAGAGNPVPGVVIVQGSGPIDMNGTDFGERIYFDIADYLSANGIAVIRYDKRTLTHGARMGKSDTVWEETIEDAISAANILKADPRIGRVYLLGHSLGGALAPRIHAMGGDFDGLIVAAATPRSLHDVTIGQYAAQIELEGHIPEVATLREMLDECIAFAAAIPNMSAEEAKRTQVPALLGGVSAYYYKDFAEHPFEGYIKDMEVPIFVIQGRNDYQVLADVDYALLQKLFEGCDNVAFRLYDGLDHRFMASDATNFIEHRNRILARAGARVDRQVTGDIAAWIKAN